MFFMPFSFVVSHQNATPEPTRIDSFHTVTLQMFLVSISTNLVTTAQLAVDSSSLTLQVLVIVHITFTNLHPTRQWALNKSFDAAVFFMVSLFIEWDKCVACVATL